MGKSSFVADKLENRLICSSITSWNLSSSFCCYTSHCAKDWLVKSSCTILMWTNKSYRGQILMAVKIFVVFCGCSRSFSLSLHNSLEELWLFQNIKRRFNTAPTEPASWPRWEKGCELARHMFYVLLIKNKMMKKTLKIRDSGTWRGLWAFFTTMCVIVMH